MDNLTVEMFDRRCAGITGRDRATVQEMLAKQLWDNNPDERNEFVRVAHEYGLLEIHCDFDPGQEQTHIDPSFPARVEFTEATLFGLDVTDMIDQDKIDAIEQDYIENKYALCEER